MASKQLTHCDLVTSNCIAHNIPLLTPTLLQEMTVHTTIPKVVTLTSRTPQGIDYWQQNTTLKYCAFLLIQSYMNISLLSILLIPGKIFIRNSINRLILIRLATSKSNIHIYIHIQTSVMFKFSLTLLNLKHHQHSIHKFHHHQPLMQEKGPLFHMYIFL